MKTIVLTAAAAKQLDALEESARAQVTAALDTYAISGVGDIKRLAGRDGYRLRVGRYRVLFDEDRLTILAVYIGKPRQRPTPETEGNPRDVRTIHQGAKRR